MLDSILYAVFRTLIFSMRFLPLAAWLVLGRRLGEVYYFLDGKKTRRAFWHLKVAFPEKTPAERRRILKGMFRNFGQNIMEMLYTPYMEESFVRGHVEIKGLEALQEVLAAGKGVLLLGSHAGSWELSNIASSFLIPNGGYAMLVRPQKKTKKIDAFLNNLRISKGVRVIRTTELKAMVEHLKQNKVLGAAADHGGKDGLPVPFFGKLAPTAAGSVKLAKKFGSGLILAFMRRKGGAYHEMTFRRFEPLSGSEDEAGLKADLTAINAVYEEWIRRYPEEYLWFYRRWKYSPERRVLILSDGKAGHVKQSVSLAEVLKDLGWTIQTRVVEVPFRNSFARRFLAFSTLLFGPRLGRRLLPFCVSRETHRALTGPAVDIVVSAGSSLAAVNLAVSCENDAKSVCIMKPGVLRCSRFDAAVIPEHDRLSCKGKNILSVEGSVTSVAPEDLKKDFEELKRQRPALGGVIDHPGPRIGVLIGGDSRHYALETSMMESLSRQLKKVLDETNGLLLMTTSRRTPPEAVEVIRREWSQDQRCRLLVIASADNPAGAVGGLLYACDIVIVSGESISMVSEAVASGKQVLVFEPYRLTEHNKVRLFLEKLQSGRHIYLVKLNEICDKLSWIIRTRPSREPLETRATLKAGLQRLLS
ncbi:MAG: ELM1/GtrOC1 family putative glycosyltransferase [Candidatus Omnitrophota bacterium]